MFPHPIMRTPLWHAPLLITLLMSGCASSKPICLPGTHPIVLDSLYFGTAKPDGIVTDQEWTTFLNDTVGVEFPEGLTVWVAQGRWRDANGSVAAETSHVLQLAHDGNQERERGLQRIIRRYKSQFRQDAVLRIRSQVCRSL